MAYSPALEAGSPFNTPGITSHLSPHNSLQQLAQARSPDPGSPPVMPSLSMDPQEYAFLATICDIPTHARQYLTSIHSYLPLLSSNETDLHAYLITPQSRRSQLSIAIGCLLNPHAFGASFIAPVGSPTLWDLQASVVFTHDAYGRGDVLGAKSTLRWACQAMQALGWHLLDSTPVLIEEKESIRRVWWQIWSLDVMLGAISGTAAYLYEVTFEVNLPLAADSELSSFGLRMRALSLLSTCTQIPTGAAVIPAHLRTLTGIGTNIALLAREKYMASNLLSGPEEEANRESAFMASLISSAAIIYLYSASYAASAFACGLDSARHLPSSTFDPIRTAGLHIFDTLRLSLSPLMPPSTHSAFFGCSVLIGAQALLRTIGEGETGVWNKSALASDLELAEWILRKQSERWGSAELVLDEVKRLRLGIDFGQRLRIRAGFP